MLPCLLRWCAAVAVLLAGPLPEAAAAGRAAAKPAPAVPAEATPEAPVLAKELQALRLAVQDLTETFGSQYPRGAQHLERLRTLEGSCRGLEGETAGVPAAPEKLKALAADIAALRQEALLANPLLNFERLLFIKRRTDRLGLPQNWQGNTSVGATGYDNELAVLSPVSPAGKTSTVYRPPGSEFVGDLCLHFDGERLLFSMPAPAEPPGEAAQPGAKGQPPAARAAHGPWQVFEMKLVRKDGQVGAGEVRQVTRSEFPGVQNYNGCYLPGGRIIYCSTACNQGVPCVGGRDHVALLYLADADGRNIRQLTFDQDHSWYPTVMNDGRVMYTRWEYSDTPHYFTRLLFQMRPDGTAQMELYGSNSYWPNSTFYARPIPGHPTRVVGVISGHHGVARTGELILFETARSQRNSDGVVQRIPGHGQTVRPVIADGLVNGSWPRFLHPWPLSGKHFLVSCQPRPGMPRGLYLVDVFDNFVLLWEDAAYAALEPVPLRARPTPPVIPDKADTRRQDALVYLSDIYAGDGLKGVPRGAVRKLRVYAHHYAYEGMGGHAVIGIDGPWDAKRMLGTVPVYEDGSAFFRAPANTPLVVQPLDAEGRALQVMRSWMTAMPGETLSCVGCHEPQGATPRVQGNSALYRRPVEIQPWRGPARGFAFSREVQPVLDKHCVGCHDGQRKSGAGPSPPDLRGAAAGGRRFSPAYSALHRYVRRPGPESDYFMLPAAEYLANTSELVQMLRKGHHGVKLDAEAWDRLITWIDLNVPYYGTWSEVSGRGPQVEARQLARQKYANLHDDLEAIPPEAPAPAFVAPPHSAEAPAARPDCPGWPWNTAEALSRQAAAGPKTECAVELDGGLKLDLALIPPGEFVMGSSEGSLDERPAARVRIARAFWMSRCEITNAQYARFDPTHDSRYISIFGKDQSIRGIPVNGPEQPVVRVPWKDALAFCAWLSRQTGRRFSLPTEAQWEYACRAGSATPFWFGAAGADFGPCANLADAALNIRAGWALRDPRAKDGCNVSAPGAAYRPNPWGLYDMHGNVAEWTLSSYRPYPYRPDDGRDQADADTEKVVRGGSWYDRPHRATASFRLAYPGWQGVYNVGFRVVCEVE